jgi:hypothetical protein
MPESLIFMLYAATNFLAERASAISRVIACCREFLGSKSFGKWVELAVPAYIEPKRLTLAEQWTRLSDIINGAAARAEEATRCHVSAGLQLDLAQYALISLVDELSAVMDVGGRRRRATVHVLGVQPPPPRPFGDALAA